MKLKTDMALFGGLVLLVFVVLLASPCGAAQPAENVREKPVLWEGEAPAEPGAAMGLRLGGSFALPFSTDAEEPAVFHGVTLTLGEHNIRVWLEQDGVAVERGEDGVYHLVDRPFDIVTDQEEKVDGLHLSLIVFDEAEVIEPVVEILERGEPIVRLSGRMAAWDHRVPWIDDELIVCPATQEAVAATDPLGEDYAPSVVEIDGLYDQTPWVIFSVTCPLNWNPETNGLCNRKTIYGFDDEDIFVGDPPLAMLVGLERSCSDHFLEYQCQPMQVVFDR